jgi:hypothetical protein
VHDPEKRKPVFRKRSCTNKKLPFRLRIVEFGE